MFSQWVGFPFMVAPGVPHWRHCRSWRCHTAWWGDGAASGPGPMSIQLCTAWWFGTFFIFPYIGIYWLCYFYQQPIIFQQHIYIYLVGGLEHFMTFHILGMSSSQLTNSIIFQRGRSTTRSVFFSGYVWFHLGWGCPEWLTNHNNGDRDAMEYSDVG